MIGRFLDEVDTDELVFGNLFQKPIRDQLPWGTSIAIKAMQYVLPLRFRCPRMSMMPVADSRSLIT